MDRVTPETAIFREHWLGRQTQPQPPKRVFPAMGRHPTRPPALGVVKERLPGTLTYAWSRAAPGTAPWRTPLLPSRLPCRRLRKSRGNLLTGKPVQKGSQNMARTPTSVRGRDGHLLLEKNSSHRLPQKFTMKCESGHSGVGGSVQCSRSTWHSRFLLPEMVQAAYPPTALHASVPQDFS